MSFWIVHHTEGIGVLADKIRFDVRGSARDLLPKIPKHPAKRGQASERFLKNGSVSCSRGVILSEVRKAIEDASTFLEIWRWKALTAAVSQRLNLEAEQVSRRYFVQLVVACVDGQSGFEGFALLVRLAA